MQSIPKNCILEFHDDTLQYLRNQYGLDTLKRTNEAIDSLEEWIKKQEHFEYKNFGEIYLNRDRQICNYIQMWDYCNHLTVLVDWSEVNIVNYIKAVDISELRKSCEIAFEGFSMRLHALHMLSSDKAVDGFISIVKQLLSEKIGARIQSHSTWDTIYEHIPQDMLPKECGGSEKSIYELRDALFDELHSEEFTKYREEMNKGRVNESYRRTDKFNDEYMGISGTFRHLTVD